MISVTEFFHRWTEYNPAIWPMQVITYVLAIGVIALLFVKIVMQKLIGEKNL